MFMSSCNWISNNKNITYYLSTRTPTSTENCLYQLREFVLCNKWSVYAYICSPPLYRSLFSKFVNFFIFWMNNLTHLKFDIHSLWSLIKNGFFFFGWVQCFASSSKFAMILPRLNYMPKLYISQFSQQENTYLFLFLFFLCLCLPFKIYSFYFFAESL